MNEELDIFLEGITYPYNAIEFARLGLPEQEDFLDPITHNIMNFPVTLFGYTFDFDTLYMLEIAFDGKRESPFDRKKFELKDVTPNRDMFERINSAINTEKENRKSIVRELCRAAKSGDIAGLKELFAANPQVHANEEYSRGFTILHYACQFGQLGTAKYLIENGADLDAPSHNKTTAFILLQKNDPSKAEELKTYYFNLLRNKTPGQENARLIKFATSLLRGALLNRDLNAAVMLLNKAGDNDLSCLLLCGDIYSRGLYGAKVDYGLAKQYYDEAIHKHNSALAKIKKLNLNYYELLSGREMSMSTSDISKSEIATLIKEFNPDALFAYAIMLQNSEILYTERYKYITYLKHSANAGFDLAQYIYANNLLDMYGFGFPINENKAVKYYKMAADQGFAIAQHAYSMCLYNGQGIKKNLSLAAIYMRLAADKGLAKAQYDYGVKLYTGSGEIQKNLSEAAKYLQLAADQGVMNAQYLYGSFKLGGDGVNMDLAQTQKYYKMAADNGLAEAQRDYAMLLITGFGGCKRNLIEGKRYALLAANQGLSEPLNILKTMEAPYVDASNNPRSTKPTI